MIFPRYNELEAMAEGYGWDIVGWPADLSTAPHAEVLLSRWEDKDGNVIAEPRSRPKRSGVSEFCITDANERQVFLRLRIAATTQEWRDAMFTDLVARHEHRTDT